MNSGHINVSKTNNSPRDIYEPIAVSIKMLDTGTLGVSGLLVRLLKSHFAGLT